MFAPPIAERQARLADSPPLRSTAAAQWSGHDPIEQARQLGRGLGNQALARLLAQHADPASGQCDDCSGDPLEHEADRAAERVMRMPAPAVSIVPPGQAGRHRAASGENGGPEQEPTGSQVAAGEAPGIVHEVVRSPGQPLDEATRAFFEPRFGHDFSRVRVLSGPASSQSARDMNARAYTVGHKMVFDTGRFAPGTHEGRRLIAHELAHIVQQSALAGRSVRPGTLQRTPAAPVTGGVKAPLDRSKIDVAAIPDVLLVGDIHQLMAIAKVAFVRFVDPAVEEYATILYDPADQVFSASVSSSVPGSRRAAFPLFGNPIAGLTQGRYILRCIGFDMSHQPVAYADRSFYVWTSAPAGKPPDIAALEAEKAALEATTRTGSGKTFDEAAIAFTRLADVEQRLGILETGTGPFVGSKCPIHPPGTEMLNCTNIVMTVLEKAFIQQGRAADWAKVQKKIAEHTKSRSKDLGLEGEDIQAALQSELHWKGIFWAPDPSYKIPAGELIGHGITTDEAEWAFRIAKKKGIYKEPREPPISIDHLVVNYAPEAPTAGHGVASTTKKDTTQLDKLKKLPFGVLAAHGATHMTLITFGKVIEVHWRKEATDVDLIQQTDLENWAVGPTSGYHYYASGTIVAPGADVDAAFR